MKVLLVDDEVKNVEMIRQEIDWGGLNIEEVLTAEDGEEAKSMILESMPEIILCDVEMPRVNGLELIGWIKEQNIETEIIILSCHDKFAYAQTAMHYGVREYLIKPFRLEELTISLSKAVFATRQKHEIKPDKSGERAFMEHGLLQMIYSREATSERRLIEMLESGESTLAANAEYRMLYIAVSQGDLNVHGYTKDEIGFILENVSSEILQIDVPGIRSIRSVKEPFYLLIYFLEGDKDSVTKKCENLLKVFKEYMKMPVYCCLTEADRLMKVVAQRDRVEKYYLNQLIIGNSSLYILGENKTETENSGTGMDETLLLDLLHREKFSEFTKCVREHMISLEKEGLLNLSELQKTEHIVSHSIYRLCDESGILASDIFTEETVLKLQKAASLNIASMLKYITYTISCIQKQQTVKKDDWGIVEQAKKYISEHYAENIGRTSIAAECHVSPGYLSKVFSESVELNIREYINQYRVNESKKLLRDPDKSISMVAMEVGFENLSYFSTVFKKISGETPAEWRKKIFL